MPYKDKKSPSAIAAQSRYNKRRKKRTFTAEQRAKRLTYIKKWQSKESSQRSITSASFKYRHGVTLEKVEELIRSQSGLCLACKRALNLSEKLSADSPTVDHRHGAGCCTEGRSCDRCRRGIIHRACNSGLGMFGDDPVKLRLAAEYLERYNNVN